MRASIFLRLESENAEKLFSMALYAEEGERVTQLASVGAGKQKTAEASFSRPFRHPIGSHPGHGRSFMILSASCASVDISRIGSTAKA
ncbi:hypothetical protein [Pseudomonas sp. EA_35y_Pfl2_R111]|uniref:hypothetical protein n=1 Tax=Pseudomonas sp. EA_35y_Pfl2_R111 TaxID=3088689 RepID=UPI0030DBF9DA